MERHMLQQVVLSCRWSNHLLYLIRLRRIIRDSAGLLWREVRSKLEEVRE